jgi:CheY-like chemotaxis protein/HPt (histidine-containing phosphotransfer) domain-containing protein
VARVFGTRALVVDDNATNRRLLDEMLKNWGLEPVAASGATEALDYMRYAVRQGRPFQLLLTDINMPEADGFSLVQDIRRDSELAATPVIVLTSGDRPGDIARGKELGVGGYLVKPVKQSELFDSIVAVLGVTAVESEKEAGAAAGTSPVPCLSILLAEDSLPNQKLAVGLLTKWGHTLTVAGNGREAVAAWESHPFDLILMDVQMPELDGLQATMLIRERERGTGRHVPIVAMTAHAMKGDREQCLAAGMDGYVPKPIRVKELSGALAGLFSGQKAAEQSAGRSTNGNGPVDWPAALETVQGDRALLRAVIDAVLGECPAVLGELEQAVGARDAVVVRRTAHTIKGALRTFEAARATDLASRIEEAGREGKLDGAPGLVADLKNEVSAVLHELAGFSVSP